jgi:hypothetical protein
MFEEDIFKGYYLVPKWKKTNSFIENSFVMIMLFGLVKQLPYWDSRDLLQGLKECIVSRGKGIYSDGFSRQAVGIRATAISLVCNARENQSDRCHDRLFSVRKEQVENIFLDVWKDESC